MNVLGVDPSLSSTGLAVVAYETGRLVATDTIVTGPAIGLDERLSTIVEATLSFVAAHDVTDAWIEQPIAYRSGTTTVRLGMVHGALRVALLGRLGVPAGEASIATVKRWATGRGDAGKPAMVRAARRRFGVVLSEDQADAALIAAWGRERILEVVEASE